MAIFNSYVKLPEGKLQSVNGDNKSEKTGQPEKMGRKTLRKNCSDSLPNLTSYRPQAANVVNHPCWCD
jgi:hypothetical protein